MGERPELIYIHLYFQISLDPRALFPAIADLLALTCQIAAGHVIPAAGDIASFHPGAHCFALRLLAFFFSFFFFFFLSFLYRFFLSRMER
ncbi:hypothetical protein K431DRAFT_10938 [Polychaeton citri CBS 116435]|uniref:Uncharacterized protein n=1 Tax=Polychaeton citri CBS 116435 TaxID=1314669 RepID=A0A9P4QFM9_9PEZI|nr:hypothetical protein K431DRAFT_10938 [Polychaeton citri CBS 116435]